MIIQIYTSKSAKEVIHYFIGSQTLEEYYSKDNQEFAGNWGGKGAELLGLKGVVRDKEFAALCRNRHPITGEQLTPRMRDDRRPGVDWTFNVPKSVSIAHAYTKDERFIWALRQTAQDVGLLIQEEAATRDRANGRRDGDRKTGVLVWAEYIHLTARPQGGIPDPHLHCHLYIPNLTWDDEEKRWKALQMGWMHKKADHYNWVAAHYLAANLRSLGLEIVPTKDSFEIAGISKEFRDKFSRRTQTIEAEAIKRGITDPAQKAKLAVLTRERKVKGLHISEIEPYWWGNLLPEEEKALQGIAAVLRRSRANELSLQMVAEPGKGRAHAAGEVTASGKSLGQKDAAWAERHKGAAPRRVSMNKATSPSASGLYAFEVTDHERRAVGLAIEHVYERQSVVSETDLVTAALKTFCVGKASVGGIWSVVAQAPLLRRKVNGEMYVTTAEVLAEEKRIAEKCLLGKGTMEPINLHWKIRDEELTQEQRDAALHALHSRDFINAIKGAPGVGKTKILKEIKLGIEGGCYKLLALAPRGTTARGVLRKEGFENAETVAKFLVSEELQKRALGGVVLVDEAGQLSTRDMDRLIAVTEKLGARLILVGDAGQHHAVERGQAFQHLEKEGNMEVAQVTQIQRQKGPYKRVVELVLAGKIDEAFTLLDEMNCLFEMTLKERKLALAKDYVAALRRGEDCLVTAPTHIEGKDVTGAMRDTLKEAGIIKATGPKRVTKELVWSDSQKSNPTEYKRGLMVEITGPVQGFRMNEVLEVVGVREDMVRVRGVGPHETRTRPLPIETPGAFTVYESRVEKGCEWEVLPNLAWTDAQKSDPDQYRPGQVVQINGHVKGYSKGEQLEVIGAKDGMVRARSCRDGQSIIKALPIGVPETFSVHEKQTIEICEGDLLRITANGRSEDRHSLENGSIYAVDYISPDGRIVLENGWRLNRDFKHMEYGYTPTSHASQGMTVDRVFLAQSPELSAGASDLNQFLVSISRGSKGVRIYTTDIELLKEQVSRVRERMMATELLQGQSEEKAQEAEKEQGRELLASELLGQTGPEISEEQAEVLREVTAMEQELEITVPPPEPERERELEMGMGM